MILQCITPRKEGVENAHMHNPYASGDPRAIIESLRLKRGFTSGRALAEAAGIPQPTLARYLNGTSETMEVNNFVALAQVLEVTLSELLGEVPIGNGGLVRELATIVNRLPAAEQRALLAAGRAMADSQKGA